MRLPRDVSGAELTKRLGVFGYSVTRQTGSHVRLTTQKNGEHHVTVPSHDPLKLGTLVGILNEVAKHFKTGRQNVAEKLFKS